MSEGDGTVPEAPEVPEARVVRAAVVPSFPLIRKIDNAWYRLERIVCSVLFLAMATLVFAAVVTETFGNRREWSDAAILLGVVLLGVRTRAVKSGEQRLGWPVSVAVAVAVTGAVIGLLELYLWWSTGGLIWAQKLTLVMMIWVALLGASMATYERSHLSLEMGEKVWPRKWLRFIKAISHGVTSGFCVVCLLLSIYLVQSQADQGLRIDANRWLHTWQAFLIMPYTFAAMAVRFLAQAVTTATGSAAPEEDRLPT
jgi:TRAP-type C4-dicarboxylate transport system permease small subunit